MSRSLEQATANRSYDPRFFEKLLAIEDRHFWFCARNKVIEPLTKQITRNLKAGYRVLEIGCGTGNTLRVIEKACPQGTVVGMDLFREGLQYAQQRTKCHLVEGDLQRPPFGARFDLICLFDVLEHLPDDTAVLRNLLDILADGGTLMLTVPAHPELWSYFDEASYHLRRYRVTDLETKLVKMGYRVEYLTHYMASIYPIVWLGRRFATLKRSRMSDQNHSFDLASAELHVYPGINGILYFLLSQEARLIARHLTLPMGTSLLVIAGKEL